MIAGLLRAQDGQKASRPGWPCVPGRAVDPSYLEVSESTGGQLFLFQRSEIARTSVVVNASHTHPATVVRALGNLNGTRDFEFPVDSSIESLLFLVSLQCRETIQFRRTVTQANGTVTTTVDDFIITSAVRTFNGTSFVFLATAIADAQQGPSTIVPGGIFFTRVHTRLPN